jgi:hypothetical protein
VAFHHTSRPAHTTLVNAGSRARYRAERMLEKGFAEAVVVFEI